MLLPAASLSSFKLAILMQSKTGSNMAKCLSINQLANLCLGVGTAIYYLKLLSKLRLKCLPAN